MSDVIDALLSGEAGEAVEVVEPVAEEQGWRVARLIVTEHVRLWCVAAGVELDISPAVDGFEDLPAISTALAAIPTDDALNLDPEDRALGFVLAQATQRGPLRAVEAALKHAKYPPSENARLCRVNAELGRLLPKLAGLAVARWRAIPDEGLFDLSPWEDAITALASELEAAE